MTSNTYMPPKNSRGPTSVAFQGPSLKCQGPALALVRIPTVDGGTVQFPVSRHVLSLPGLKKIRQWRPSLVQQASALVLVLSLFASSYGITYGKLQSTLAYFRDDETSRANVFAAISLDFLMNPGEVSTPIEAGGEIFLRPLMKTESGSSPIMYRAFIEEVGTPAPLCGLLLAVATTSPFVYSGALTSLSTEATTTTGHWGLSISLPDATGLSDGEKCTVHLVYRGWNKDAPENTGYTDEERDSFTFIFKAPTSLESVETPLAPHEPDNLGDVLGAQDFDDSATSTEPVSEVSAPTSSGSASAPPPSPAPAEEPASESPETAVEEPTTSDEPAAVEPDAPPAEPADEPAQEQSEQAPADTSATVEEQPAVEPEPAPSTEPPPPVDAPPPPPPPDEPASE